MTAPPVLGVPEIARLIPHRHPMLMIDRVVELRPGVGGAGIKNVTGGEHYFPGHFPDNPIMPGVFSIEAIAQMAAIVLSATPGGSETSKAAHYLVMVEEMKFRRPIVPGDTMTVTAEVVKRIGSMVRVSGEVRVGGERAVSGRLVVGRGPA